MRERPQIRRSVSKFLQSTRSNREQGNLHQLTSFREQKMILPSQPVGHSVLMTSVNMFHFIMLHRKSHGNYLKNCTSDKSVPFCFREPNHLCLFIVKGPCSCIKGGKTCQGNDGSNGNHDGDLVENGQKRRRPSKDLPGHHARQGYDSHGGHGKLGTKNFGKPS